MPTITPLQDQEVEISEQGTLKISKNNQVVAAGTNNLYVTVPTGKKWVLKNTVVQIIGTTCTYTVFQIKKGGVSHRLGITAGLAAGVPTFVTYTLLGEITLIEGEQFRIDVGGVAGAGTCDTDLLVQESDM